MTDEKVEIKPNKWQTLTQNFNQNDPSVEGETIEPQVALEQAKLIGAPIEFESNPPPPDEFALALLEKIPLLAVFLKSFDGMGMALSKLAVLKGSEAAKKAALSFQVGSVLLASIDLFRIPIMFLVAWRLEVKLPFTLTHAAKLLYSAVALSLALAAILAPLTAGSAIGIAIATLGVTASTVVLGRLFFDLYKTSKELKQVAIEIGNGKTELEKIQKEAEELAATLQNPERVDEYPVLVQRVSQLKEEYELKKEEVQALYDKQSLLLKVWDKELSIGAGIDKAVALGLATGVLAGVVTSLFFPPLGLAIVAGCAVAGGGYLVARVTAVVIKALVKKHSKTPEKAMDNSSLEKESLLKKDKALSLENIKAHESTGDVMQILHGKEKATQILRKKTENTVLLREMERSLADCIERKDRLGVLCCFTTMANYAEKRKAVVTDLQDFVECLQKAHPSALPMLKKALGEPSIAMQAKQNLLNYKDMADVLKERGIINEAEIAAAHLKTEMNYSPLEQGKSNNNSLANLD